MRTQTIGILLAGLGLGACDAATQIAGDAVEGEMRNAVAVQCQQVAEGAGIVAGRVAAVCECAVQTFVSDSELTLDDISRTRIEGIVNQCAARNGGETPTGGGAASTEETGG